MRWRFLSIIGLFIFLYLFLVFHIYNLQLVKGQYYAKRTADQIFASGGILPARGEIFFTDKNNNLIQAALNKDYSLIFVEPKKIQKNISSSGATIDEYVEKLSFILDLSRDEIIKKISKENDSYEVLVQKASQEQINKVNEIKMKGIYVDVQKLRLYPFKKLAAHLLGFVAPAADTDDANSGIREIGRYGLELKFNDYLSGKAGKDSDGKISAPQNGEDLFLTIDTNLQSQASDVLKKIIDNNKAEGGSVIIEDPKTGRILAMESYPTFDPNEYSKYELASFLNPTTQLIYEPGSVFKVVTMAAGIDSGKITPDTAYVDTGSVVLNGKKIQNWDLKAYGKMTMTNVIEHSLNTGTVFAERTMGHQVFYDYLVKFGFNELTNISLPGEVRGNLNNLNLKNIKDIDFATVSYGQGVSVTPIRMISAVAAIANGGVLMKPIILSNEQPQVVRRVVSVETAKKVVDMMVSAVKLNKIADIPNYSVAGKTGTAFIPEKGGYSDDVINTFIGFAPAYDPEFIILIKLVKPVNAPLAGTTVVPAFRELAQFVLNYYNIAPDKL